MRLIGQLGGAVDALAVQGDTAYAGVGPRLLVFDVSIPQQPVLLGQTPPFADIIQDVVATGARVYVAGQASAACALWMSPLPRDRLR